MPEVSFLLLLQKPGGPAVECMRTGADLARILLSCLSCIESNDRNSVFMLSILAPPSKLLCEVLANDKVIARAACFAAAAAAVVWTTSSAAAPWTF